MQIVIQFIYSNKYYSLSECKKLYVDVEGDISASVIRSNVFSDYLKTVLYNTSVSLFLKIGLTFKGVPFNLQVFLLVHLLLLLKMYM